VRTFIILGTLFALLQLSGCSSKTTATARLPDSTASVGIAVKSPLRKLKVNELTALPISIYNSGDGIIPSEGKADGSMKVFATYHWTRGNNEMVVWDGVRTPLGEDIGHAKSLDVSLSLKAPSDPGRYILVIDLVQEGAVWFQTTGSQTAGLLFTVE